MNLLRTERDTLDAYIPGLDKYLAEIPLPELEQPVRDRLCAGFRPGLRRQARRCRGLPGK